MVCPVRNVLYVFDHFMFRKMNAWPRYTTRRRNLLWGSIIHARVERIIPRVPNNFLVGMSGLNYKLIGLNLSLFRKKNMGTMIHFPQQW
jgi:hypothetical protein